MVFFLDPTKRRFDIDIHRGQGTACNAAQLLSSLDLGKVQPAQINTTANHIRQLVANHLFAA